MTRKVYLYAGAALAAIIPLREGGQCAAYCTGKLTRYKIRDIEDNIISEGSVGTKGSNARITFDTVQVMAGQFITLTSVTGWV
jgi:hypothetical protein